MVKHRVSKIAKSSDHPARSIFPAPLIGQKLYTRHDGARVVARDLKHTQSTHARTRIQNSNRSMYACFSRLQCRK